MILVGAMSTYSSLYSQDFQKWIYSQISLLRAGKTDEIDVTHLIDELEDMGKSNVRELESRLMILLAHLLKWQFQLASLAAQWKNFEGKSWRTTIIEQRAQIAFLLKKVPSLKSQLQEAITEAYPESVALAVKETRLRVGVFPVQCPYTMEQILDDEFYPEVQDC